MSVNSAAVLRLTGRGGGTVVGAPRGRSSSRGRGELPMGCAAMDPGQSCLGILSGPWLEPFVLMLSFFLLKVLKPFQQGGAGELILCLVMILHILVPNWYLYYMSLPGCWVGNQKGKVVLGWSRKFFGSELLEITLLKA